MHHNLSLATLLIFTLAGCSSPPKSSKGTATASTANNDNFTSQAKKLQQDFSTTESDFSKLESQVQSKK